MQLNWYKIKTFLYKNRLPLVGLAVLFFGLLWIQGGYAFPSAKDIALAIFAILLSLVVVILYYVFLVPIFFLIAIAMWVLVEVASFQYFINVPAVINGWTIMRDLVNMGIVVFLLYLAFATLLSLSSVNLEKDLIKLILAVVLVNFSRMIVGLLIDASQIVMLTFVNGFRNVAGGNVINGLGLKKFVADSVKVTADIEVAGGNFIKMTLGIVMGIIILATIVMFVAYLIMRVVKLWILTIMSPLMILGYFTGKLSTFTNTWKKEFEECLTAGPFMAFYLWFALTVIGTTGDKTAITTPSGAMADNLGDQGNMNTGDVTNSVFTMIIGAALLWASFDMAKKMAGAAGAVGEKVWQTGKGAVIGGMAAIGKTAAKGLDKGVQLGSVYATGRDFSATGIKEWGKEKWADIKTVARDTERKILEKGRLRREQRQIGGVTGTEEYKGLDKQKEALSVGSKNLEDELKALKAEDSLYKENVDGAENKKGAFLRQTLANQESLSGNKQSLDSVLAAMNADESGRLDYDQTMSSIDGLVASGVIDEATSAELKKGFLQTADNKAVYSDTAAPPALTQAKDSLEARLQDANLAATQAGSLETILQSGDATQIKQSLDTLGDQMGLSATEKTALLEKYTGGQEARRGIISSKQKQKADIDKDLKTVETEMKQMVQSVLLKDKKSAGHRVVKDRTEAAKKAVRSHLDRKYSEVDNPDEIASFLKDGVTVEEMNYLLEKAGDDVSEVLDKAGYEKDLGGLKALYAKNVLGTKHESAVEAMRTGKATKQQDALITAELNKVLGKSTWDTMDIIDKKNRKENASLSYGITLDPHGVHGFKDNDKHYETVIGAYTRGKINAKALTPFLTRKGEDGQEHLTDLGKAFLLTHNRELGKDAFSDEFGKGVLDAIRNDMEKVKELFESMQGGEIPGSMDGAGYDKDNPSSNPLYHYYQTVLTAATGVKGSERERILDRIREMEAGNR